MLDLSTSVSSLKMVGPTYTGRLKKLGIITVFDLLYHIPSRYIDYSLVSTISNLQPGEQVTIRGKVSNFKSIYTRTKTTIQKAYLTDGTGEARLVFYNQPYLSSILKKDTPLLVAGIVEKDRNTLRFTNPEFEIIISNKPSIHTGRLVPVYPLTEGVSSKWLRSRIYSIISKFEPNISEFLPDDLLKLYNLVNQRSAVYQIHFPDSLENVQKARQRLSVDELLILHLASLQRKKSWEKITSIHSIRISKFMGIFGQLIASLPFRLTQAQKKVTAEILTDLSKTKPMNRMLLGDVGSGKTVVAALAAYIVACNHKQILFLAPTEILAQQHFDTFSKILTKTEVTVRLITAHSKPKDATSATVVIGTHALLNSKFSKRNVALVVIDEQQRFGVSQRAILREKGRCPHLLTMTATPIPRTLALTLYADLSLSTLDEMPKGRLPIKTWVVPPEKRESAYEWIKKLIADPSKSAQVFVVCPIIEESESLEQVKAASVEYERLKTQVFPNLRLGLIHGRLKKSDKEEIIEKFRMKKIDILVATPIIEVGIDIPAASVIIVEAADRFGLAQLHQLRGRVGRSSAQSYCLLFTDSKNEKANLRLKLLEKYQSGPKLAQMDFEMRGPGDIFGLRQHGLSDIRIADLSDSHMLNIAKQLAQKLTVMDPALENFPYLRSRIGKYTMEKIASD